VAAATAGIVGAAARATEQSLQFDDTPSKISPKAKGKTNAEQHGVIAPGQCPGGDAMPDDSNLAQMNDAIRCLVNGERSDNGLPALGRAPQLDQASAGMCQRIVTEHFFAHRTPDGKTVVDRVRPTGYIPRSGDWVLGENLAWGNGPLSTPQAIVNGWMNSASHRANILAPDYKEIGLAACMGSPLDPAKGGTVYANTFGARSHANPDIELPGHSESPGTSAAAAEAAASKPRRRAACRRRAKQVKPAKKRRAAFRRCRRL
jgi:uncharacterized protein YkwD